MWRGAAHTRLRFIPCPGAGQGRGRGRQTTDRPVAEPWSWRARIGVLLLAAVFFALVTADRLLPPELSRLQHESLRVLAADGTLLHVERSADGYWRLPVRLAEVDPAYVAALLAFEDQRFRRHPGVDPLALARAAGQWLRHGRIVSGGSTITMQLARLLEPRPRTLGAKLIECLRALQLEAHFSKDELLAMYLTLAPYGGNLEGLRAASLAWFGKSPRELRPAEYALLVALPQSPTRLRPDRRPEAARLARDKVLMRLAAAGVLDAARAAEAREEAVPAQRLTLPRAVPHLAAALHAAQPQAFELHSTLDARVQAETATLAQRALAGLGAQVNAALVVVEQRSGRVLAYVGAAELRDPQRHGSVDLLRALRSPGSTLKPLVYGLAFDDGVLHPDTRIDDVPTRFGDYSPGNFMERYYGEVSVREALQRSLNVPAVAVLDRVGPLRVAQRLREAGLELQLPDGAAPGLPIVLGGAGMRLWDLAGLYAALANGGSAPPLTLMEAVAAVPRPPMRLLGPVAAEQLARILEDAPPPAEAVPPGDTRQPRRIAYKTGTSYGFRDAWALGYDGAHTVGVWVGRPDGSPNPGHFGRNTAAPLLWRVFDLLAPSPRVAFVEQTQLPDGGRALAPNWRHLAGSAARDTRATLALSFPLPGARVALPADGAPLPLVASGGLRPLRWLVNGVPLTGSPMRRSVAWQPDGEGAARVTVVDAAGQSASAEFWLMR